MSKELEKLSLKEKWDNFLDFVDAPTQARLLDCDCKEGLEQYRYLRTEIEDALKNYEELTNRPVIMYGRTNGQTKAIIDLISRNYKEVKIINLEDENKLIAFDIIKKKNVDVSGIKNAINAAINNKVREINAIGVETKVFIEPYIYYNARVLESERLTPEEFKLLKETVL